MDAHANLPPEGRLLALDLGEKRVGVAVSDELRLTSRPLPPLARSNWKDLLGRIAKLCGEFDVKGVVVGLPLLRGGVEGEAAGEARRVARNLSLSLRLPVFLQDEHLTSVSAELTMRGAGATREEISRRVDSEAASLILSDFLFRRREGEE
jgi:putative holliday junction resolvase